MNDYAEDEVLGKAYDARLMRRFLTYLRPYRRLILLILAITAIRIATDLVTPLILRTAIDGPILQGHFEGLVTYAGFFLLAVVLSGLLDYLQTLVTNRVGQNIIYDLRLQVFAHLQRLPLSFFDKNPVGRLIVRITNDVENLSELFISGMVDIAANLTLLIGVVVLMFVIDWRLALVTLSTAPLVAAVALLFRKHARTLYRDMRQKIARLNAYLNESVNGMRIIQMFTREADCLEKFRALNGDYCDSAEKAVLAYSLFFPAVELFSTASVALLVWFGGISILDGTLTFGSFLAFWYCAQKFFQPIRDLSEKYNILQSAMASSERLFKLLDTPDTLSQPAHPRPAPTHGEVVFENVSFSYDGRTSILNNVSFRIAPGERVAVVGLTGAGKTTLINLLSRLYDVSDGRILLDGTDVRQYDRHGLRRRIGMVLQDVFLFAGSVEENLRLKDPSIDRARIKEALRAAHADGVIAKLPHGLDSDVRERGSLFSAGERQLLSFARALANDPLILVLDEATACVDAQTEYAVRKAVAHMTKGRTSLVIAHRFSTIQSVDRVLLLHRGRIRAEGTHSELMKQDDLYARLIRLQSLS